MIIIDDREVLEHPELQLAYDIWKIPVRVERLLAADYAFLDRNSEPTGIERCEIGNLIQKMRSGELESQLVHCDENYSHVILLVEGVYDSLGGLLTHFKKSKEGKAYYRVRIEPSIRYSDIKALMIRLSELGIELIESPNFTCSMELVKTIYMQRNKPEEQHTLFKKLRKVAIPTKLSANPAVSMLLSLCPRLPEKVAVRLIYKYETIWNILQAPDRELLEVEGFGKGLLDKFKKGVGKVG